MGLGVLQMVAQGGIRNAEGHQRNHGDDTLGLYINCFLISDLSKQHIVIKVGKQRGKFPQLGPSGGLGDFFFHSVHASFLYFTTPGYPL